MTESQPGNADDDNTSEDTSEDTSEEISEDTSELVRRAQAGDRVAQEALFSEAYPNLLQAARFRLGPSLRSRLDTQDLAQTVYLDAFRDLPKYQYEGQGSFFRWVLGILENKIRSRAKFFGAKKRAADRVVPLDEKQGPAEDVTRPTARLIQNEERERREWAMDRLDKNYRDVIIQRYYLKTPWAEIGEQLGKSP